MRFCLLEGKPATPGVHSPTLIRVPEVKDMLIATKSRCDKTFKRAITSLSTTEVSRIEVSPTEISPTEVSPLEVSPREVSPAEVGPTEVSHTEVSRTEVGRTEVSSLAALVVKPELVIFEDLLEVHAWTIPGLNKSASEKSVNHFKGLATGLGPTIRQ